ncbi:hypothetical protein M0R45_020184 [Rubus argutus]|uniref:Uncharacterized protein n=1 Tax=Rubus argutus TaxID=59490 RepID=A0AAW1X9Y4_RUBAR
MKADEINSKLLNLEGVNGAEEEQLTLWINLLLNSERELRERLVRLHFLLLKVKCLLQPQILNLDIGFLLELAQMEQWVELNQDHVQNELRVLASEVRKHERDYTPDFLLSSSPT